MAQQDFKYVIQDLSNVYIGAKYTYGEMMDVDAIPFKFKAILSHYMLKEVEADTTAENHLFYLDKEGRSYMAYKQLKAKFKMSVWEEADGKKRKTPGYISREYTVDQVLDDPALMKKKDSIVVEEIHLSKLALMSFSL